MRVLHITNWYPSQENLKEALWIQRQIDALGIHLDEFFILHLEVKPSSSFGLTKERLPNGAQRIFYVPTSKWFFIEVLTAFLLVYYLMILRVRKYDLINFHIAYPLLTFWHFIKIFVRIPIVISEHWSAYHFNFNVADTKKLRRVKNIFHQNIPVVTVSQALYQDIKKFSGSDFPNFVLPNIVEKDVFNHKNHNEKDISYFFMISQWKWPKNPFVIIKAFAEFSKKNDIELEFAGYGAQLDEMKELVNSLQIRGKVKFLGKLDSPQIATKMNEAIAYLHASEYETFSVVCAEAVCCGTPVVASAVGGIPEFINNSNGILVFNNSVQDWIRSLDSFILSKQHFNRQEISLKASRCFGKEEIGRRYACILKEVVGEKG